MKITIYNPKTKLHDFFLESLYVEFKKKEIEYDIMDENYIHMNEINYLKDILLILIDPHFIIDCADINNELMILSKKYRYKIFYITEPINMIIEKNVFQSVIKMINPFCIWTYSVENFNKLNIKQPIFKIFPNYNSYYNFTNKITIKDLQIKSKDQIIFLGNITPNRKEICDEFGNLLINYTDKWTKTEWTNILENYVFYLNIHRRLNCKSFEAFRIIPILSNGGFIISEKCNEIEEKIYEKYNIIFVERKLLYQTFLEKMKNINNEYEDIYNKTLLFQNDMINNEFLDNFIRYFNSIL